MAAKRDYYEILGINRNADEGAIKKAYRKLAKQYHPDANGGNTRAEQRFKEVTEAYTVLSDPEKRKLYDRFGHAAFDGTGAGAESAGGFSGFGGNGSFRRSGPFGGYQEFHFDGGDMGNIFDDLFGGFGRGFGGPAKMRGRDLEAEVQVTFDEAAFGCDKIIRIQREDGSIQSLQVHIPAGIENGKIIRLRGKGYPAASGEPGDLLLRVTAGSRPGFERKGMDIYSVVQVPFADAVLGGEVPIETIYGTVMCKISGGTQSGSKIRLRGKGIVSMTDPSHRGDHYVTVQIQVPVNLSREAREKLREFQAACSRQERRTHGAA